MTAEIILFKIFELLIIPLSFIAIAYYQIKKYGKNKTFKDIANVAIFSYFAEELSILLFHSHSYGHNYAIMIFDVPLVIVLGWYVIITMAKEIISRLKIANLYAQIALIAAIALNIDFILDPIATAIGLWSWAITHHFFGVPFGNFLGWFFIIVSYLFFCENTFFHNKIKNTKLLFFFHIIAPIIFLLVMGVMWTKLGMDAIITPEFTLIVIVLSSIFIFIMGTNLHNKKHFFLIKYLWIFMIFLNLFLFFGT